MHVTLSAPLLLVAGAFALYRLYRWLLGRIDELAGSTLVRALIFCSLLVLPLVAVLPSLEWRASSFVVRAAGSLEVEALPLVPSGLARASVFVPANTRDAFGDVVAYIQARTTEQEPIFVYPTLPLFYYLTDRPNPTRFDHIYPGAATPAELEQLIETLETRRVRYVIWDQFWVEEWSAVGRADQNAPLTDYLLKTYKTEALLGPFHILRRSE
jgi:hypothetical protein